MSTLPIWLVQLPGGVCFCYICIHVSVCLCFETFICSYVCVGLVGACVHMSAMCMCLQVSVPMSLCPGMSAHTSCP